ncbi:MAG: helix-turn-helix domain-containing protein [Chloroflexi bacterium]|nr:helix-turn-helix domain-containing protein [Chloroflexota bacterium]
MDTYTPEQELRQEAIRRRLEGQSRPTISKALRRSLSWVAKWWAEYRHNPKTDFADPSRAPHTVSRCIPLAVARAVVNLRRTLEAARTPETKYGFIGARAIRTELERQHITPLPSLATIQRILMRHALTHPQGAGQDSAYYPGIVAWTHNVLHATDIIIRYVQGGEAIHNFHTFDHYSHAAHLSQHADKTSATTGQHLLETWADLGLPLFQQFDNEDCFKGGHTHPRVWRRGLSQSVVPWFLEPRTLSQLGPCAARSPDLCALVSHALRTAGSRWENAGTTAAGLSPLVPDARVARVDSRTVADHGRLHSFLSQSGGTGSGAPVK